MAVNYLKQRLQAGFVSNLGALHQQFILSNNHQRPEADRVMEIVQC